MIVRFNTLRNLGRFSVLRCIRGEQGKFAKMNVIYAPNAAGKSTLCDVFRSMSTGKAEYLIGRKRFGAQDDPEIVVVVEGDPEDQNVRFQDNNWRNGDAAPKVLVYDDRFVSENVLIGHHISVDQRRSLYGLVIGSRGVELKQAVDTAELNLQAANRTLTSAQRALEALIPEGFNIESFRGLPESEEIDNRVMEAAEALESATRSRRQAEGIRRRPNLRSITVPDLPADLNSVLSATLDRAALEAEGKIREHLHQHTDGLSISWVAQGHRGQAGTACPHCGQDMEGLEIFKAYQEYFSGALQEQEKSRTEVSELADRSFGEVWRNSVRESFDAHQTEQTWWGDAAGVRFDLPARSDISAIIDAMTNIHQALAEALARKQAQPGQVIRLSDPEQHAIEVWRGIVDEIRAYNEGLAEINEALDQRREAAATIDLAPLQQTLATLKATKKRHEQNAIEAYAAYDRASADKRAAERAKTQANEDLRRQSDQMMAEYGQRINALLTDFGADFRIVSDGVNFRGGPPAGQLAIEILGTRVSSASDHAADPALPSLANTLSGGDRSTLALSFFLAVAEYDPDIADTVIVFDDPYHNQDRSRRQRTIEHIHRLTHRARQCFVLSHDLEFARAVPKIPGIRVRTFQLDPLGEEISLEGKDLPLPPSRAYEMNYTLLRDFLANQQDFPERLREIAATLRVILEEYLRLKFPLQWEENDWLGDMIRKIDEAEADSPLHHARHLVEELNSVKNYSRPYHHGADGTAADIPDSRELLTYVEQTLSIISK